MENDHSRSLSQEQIDWCNRHIAVEWRVNTNGEIEVENEVSFKKSFAIKKFEVQFAETRGFFDCSHCDNLKSLKGAPVKVGGYFDCSRCHSLTSLEGAPSEVGGYFDCSYCTNLTSLEGAPRETGTFDCSSCYSLTSLEGAPLKIKGNFFCNHCEKLDSFSVDIVNDDELFQMWLKTTPRRSPEKFLRDKRGTIIGKKFGI